MVSLQIAIAAAAVLLLLLRSLAKKVFNPLKHLPVAPQVPAHKRLLVEPSPEQLRQWAQEIPNEGLIRYRGRLNIEKLLVTDTQLVEELMVKKAYEFQKPPIVSRVIRSLLGDGLVVVEGNVHKVCAFSSTVRDSLTLSPVVAKDRSETRLQASQN